ncbi:MAG: site-specific DNA-methyltransferase [Sulfolobales archaeon]
MFGRLPLKRVDDRVVFVSRDSRVAIVNDDFLTTDLVEDNSVDLIVTSPPYNVDIKYGVYRDDIPYDKYLEFTEKWLAKALELAKPDGRLCLNIPLDKSKGRDEEGFQSVYADIVEVAKRVGWKYFTTIVWNEGNISRRTAWGSWCSASAPYVIAPVEVVVVMYKERWKKVRQGVSDITREEFIEWTNGLWTFPGENPKTVGHPAPFPIELPKRCIKLFTYVDDVVLDPFLGSGTTLVAVALTGRRGIGVEIERKYCDTAVQRLKKETGIDHIKLYEYLNKHRNVFSKSVT